ncbi:MAG TPA: lipid-binding SYLF domain-containing protein [Firmicutes bacterium]|nr:lipid-binding SYLF domain-containing protein [Bacillota bacterium]
MNRQVGRVGFAVLIIGLLIGSAAWAASPETIISQSITALQDMAVEPDAGTMVSLLKEARGVAIFPSVVKAGIFLGGKYGEGLVLQRDPATGSWCGPSFISMKGVSYGLQFGVQSTALVLVINNDEGMERFRGSQEFTLGGDIGIAAGPIGRQAGASTDVQLKSAIYSYSMSKGLFAGFSLEGAIIETDHDANRTYWGRAVLPEDILATPAAGSKIQPLIDELERLMAQS